MSASESLAAALRDLETQGLWCEGCKQRRPLGVFPFGLLGGRPCAYCTPGGFHLLTRRCRGTVDKWSQCVKTASAKHARAGVVLCGDHYRAHVLRKANIVNATRAQQRARRKEQRLSRSRCLRQRKAAVAAWLLRGCDKCGGSVADAKYELQSLCTSCTALRAKDIAHQASARRRARKRAVPHAPYSRAAIFAEYGGTCAYCDAPAEHLDHVNAISRGGADAPHNLLPACAPCNLGKGAKSLAEWALSWTR